MANDSWELSRFKIAQKSPGFLLWQVYFIWKRKIESCLEPFNLTHIQFVLLAGLAYLQKSNNDISQVELATFTQCDVTMTSQVIRTLEKKKLVERYQKSGDERAKYSKLTSNGMNVLKNAIQEVEAVDMKFFQNLENDFDFFISGLEKLAQKNC